MSDETYKSAQDKADELGLSFSSYMSMLAKKDKKSEIIDVRSKEESTPINLPYVRFSERGKDSKTQILSRELTKWASAKRLNLASDKIKLIVNKILDETK